MFITGNPFSDVLTFFTLVLPLLSVCFILFRKEYADNSTTLLMVLCLFSFIQRLLVLYNGLFEFSFPLVHNTFNIVEFLLLVFILRDFFPELKSHYILNSFLIAYFSSIVTYYGIRGFGNDEFELRVIQYGLIALLMIASLVFQVRRDQLTMMNTPFFWFTLGTLFYFAFCTFWEIGKKYLFSPADISGKELDTFPSLIMTIRFAFYALAMWLLQNTTVEEKILTTVSLKQKKPTISDEMDYLNLLAATEVPGEKIL